MSGLNLSQRLWQIADGTVQRALDGFAAQYDDAVKKLNNAFDFSDKALTIRLPTTLPSATVTGALAVDSVVTPGGFKSVVGPWQRGNAAFGTSPTPLAWGSDSNGTGASALFQGFYPTHSGSIVGMQLAGQATTATTLTTTVYKNGVATTASLAKSLTAGTTAVTATFAKGAMPFAANDRLEMYYTANAANTGQFVSAFTVEFGS